MEVKFPGSYSTFDQLTPGSLFLFASPDLPQGHSDRLPHSPRVMRGIKAFGYTDERNTGDIKDSCVVVIDPCDPFSPHHDQEKICPSLFMSMSNNYIFGKDNKNKKRDNVLDLTACCFLSISLDPAHVKFRSTIKIIKDDGVNLTAIITKSRRFICVYAPFIRPSHNPRLEPTYDNVKKAGYTYCVDVETGEVVNIETIVEPTDSVFITTRWSISMTPSLSSVCC